MRMNFVHTISKWENYVYRVYGLDDNYLEINGLLFLMLSQLSGGDFM